jgi:hypothetical protein
MMAIYALVSAGGSPGVTTAALALALTWPRPVVVAECDPAGGAILAGLFAGHLIAPRGLLSVAFEADRGQAAISAEIKGQLAPLGGRGSARFLAGLSDPRQAAGLVPAWPAVARAMAGLSADVIADCGRLSAGAGQPSSVLTEAEAVVMVLRPTMRQVAAASPRIEMITQLLGGPGRIGLLLVGDRGHASKEVAATLGVPVLACLPLDLRTAAVLSDGEGRRTGLSARPLMRAARIAGRTMSPGGPGAGEPEMAAAAGGSVR